MSAKCATPAVCAQENPDEHHPSPDTGRKQLFLLTENSDGTNLGCLVTVFRRAHGSKVGAVGAVRKVGEGVLYLNFG